MKLSVGMNIGRIKLSDGKIASAATVESLSDADVTLVAKRGPQTIRTTLSYVSLKVYAERAGNDFFKNRSAQAQAQTNVRRDATRTAFC
ncbi:hypothetical protein [Propionivibrio sp.]|uniref:hypothetical protein n=1 Tax=Propionivibrio sp. TaxID=2212460 RepID=UPI0025D2AD8F|nr:hypothetical protein [Propionivibrio sp.]MBK8745547.1 hypothetical protein [Propionivibrio sp.]